MRRIILGLAVTLDGFIEGPNGEYDWCFTDQDYGLSEFFNSVDAIIMGRKSFEVASSSDLEGNNPWKGMKTYVLSRTMKAAPSENVELVRSLDEINQIKEANGKNIWLFGGADLTTQFLNNDLLDELWLSVHPILLGSGKPLFQNIRERKTWQLTESKAYDTGLVSLKYSKR